MSVRIEPCNDVALLGPILRVLRDALDDEVFEARLSRAVSDCYRVLVARNAGGVQGCLGCRFSHDLHWGKSLYIDDRVVQPRARGHGLGAALLAAARKEARAQNCDHLRLCSSLTRAQAHRFYEKNGFDHSSAQFSYAVRDGEF